MIRHIFLLFCLAFLTAVFSCKSSSDVGKTKNTNQIDQLKSKEQVIEFVVKNFDEFKTKDEYKTFKIKPIKELYRDKKLLGLIDSLNLSSWYIQDINSDNINDILIYGYYSGTRPIVILGSNNNKYVFLDLDRGERSKEYLPILAQIDKRYYIKNYETTVEIIAQGELLEFIKSYYLAVVDNALIEYPFSKKEYDIEKISMYQYGCKGYCPQIIISITKKGIVNLAEISHNKKHGFYTKNLKKEKLDDLWKWASYIPIKTLKNYYDGFLHEVQVKLVIKYNQGTIKEVHASGKSGTFGLKELFRKIDEIYVEDDFTFVSPISKDKSEIDLEELMY